MNWSEPVALLTPPGPETMTSTVPALCAGEVAVIDVGPFTTNDAAVPPNDTDVAPVKPPPVIVTEVPPVTGPLEGLTFETAGTARNVN